VKLPIVFHEREIMENIENNIVTIVCGETGSGKSTQLPKFIYNASL
jgi:ATP-dependent RNA helicase DHX37/DHR1